MKSEWDRTLEETRKLKRDVMADYRKSGEKSIAAFLSQDRKSRVIKGKPKRAA